MGLVRTRVSASGPPLCGRRDNGSSQPASRLSLGEKALRINLTDHLLVQVVPRSMWQCGDSGAGRGGGGSCRSRGCDAGCSGGHSDGGDGARGGSAGTACWWGCRHRVTPPVPLPSPFYRCRSGRGLPSLLIIDVRRWRRPCRWRRAPMDDLDCCMAGWRRHAGASAATVATSAVRVADGGGLRPRRCAPTDPMVTSCGGSLSWLCPHGRRTLVSQPSPRRARGW